MLKISDILLPGTTLPQRLARLRPPTARHLSPVVLGRVVEVRPFGAFVGSNVPAILPEK